MTLNLIDPAQIPQFVGSLDELEAAARGLKSDGGNISKTGGDIHTKFQGLSAYYEAPEAEQLFVTTRPVQQAAKTFGDSLATVSDALMEYAHTVRPIARQLQDLQRRATDFRKSIEGHPHWRSNGDRVKEHNDLWAEVNAAVSAFEDAARTAADKIDKIFNGTQYIADDGTHKPNMYGYSADTLDHAKGLPWGEPVEQTYRGWDVVHWAGQFWDGFVIDGVGGALSGLGHLINPFDWHTFTQTWSGLGHVAVGFYARYGPNPAAAGYSVANGMDPGGVSGLPTGELPQWMQDDEKAFSNFAKSMVAWDEWKKNPVRAAGSTLFNGVTMAAGPMTKLGEAGDAGRFAMAAKTAGVLGKAGRIVDPMTYISKGVGQVASKLPRISDIANTIDRLRLGSSVHDIGAPSTFAGVHLPDGSIQLPDSSILHPNGDLSLANGAVDHLNPHQVAALQSLHGLPDNAPTTAHGLSTVHAPEETALSHDGFGAHHVAMSDVPKVPEGSILRPDGELHLPNGDVIYLTPEQATSLHSHHTAPNTPAELPTARSETPTTGNPPHNPTGIPKEAVKLPDGSYFYPNGELRLPNGEIKPPEGSVMTPDGSVIYPNGDVRLPNGHVVPPSAEAHAALKPPADAVKLTDGAYLYPDGSIHYPNGDIRLPVNEPAAKELVNARLAATGTDGTPHLDHPNSRHETPNTAAQTDHEVRNSVGGDGSAEGSGSTHHASTNSGHNAPGHSSHDGSGGSSGHGTSGHGPTGGHQGHGAGGNHPPANNAHHGSDNGASGSTSGHVPGSGGSREHWQASDNMVGTARGKTLNAPAPRHNWSGIRKGVAKETNTIILPGYNQEVKGDISQIAAGKAVWHNETQRYEISGRTYAIEPSGTVFPESGPGFVRLSRAEYSALQALMRVNGDLSKCEKFFANAHQFRQEPNAVQTAINLYRTYQQ